MLCPSLTPHLPQTPAIRSRRAPAFRALPLLATALLVLTQACATRPPAPPAPRPDLRYYVRSADDPALLEVTLVAENIQGDSLDFTFPVWLPGDFRPIEPGKWVEDVRSYDRTTAELPVRRLGPNVWRVYPRRQPYFLVSYTLHPVRPDGFKRSSISELTRNGGYFTGAVAFGHLKGLENLPLTLTFEFNGATPVVCSLDEAEEGRYRARSAFELSQSGCAYGRRMEELDVTVGGVPHRIVLVAPGAFDADSLRSLVREVGGSFRSLFETLPFPEYTLFVHFVDRSQGGLGGSALFRGSAYYLPEIQASRVRSSELPYLFAHQLFHAWNLWAFPPRELEHPPLDRSVATPALWFVEGMAEHYARVVLARSRTLPRAEIYAELARDLRALQQHPAAGRANLETTSVAAGSRSEREILDPLALKSPLAALALDVELRRATANAFGSDSLLRYLEGSDDTPRVLPYDSIVGWLIERGGPPLRALYSSSIAGSGVLPYDAILAATGLQLAQNEVEELNLGGSLVPDGKGALYFQQVEAGSLADRIGVRAGDRLVAVNQLPVTSDDLLPLLALTADLRSGLRTGKPLRIRVERGGRETDLNGTLGPWTRQVLTIVEDEAAGGAAAAVREGIFSGQRRETARLDD